MLIHKVDMKPVRSAARGLWPRQMVSGGVAEPRASQGPRSSTARGLRFAHIQTDGWDVYPQKDLFGMEEYWGGRNGGRVEWHPRPCQGEVTAAPP
ncbi:unnamed protein product [Colias eurytheme]|nr:unnamed protein product [Colias eurytheme]